MSGGTWNYQQWDIEDLARRIEAGREVIIELLKAAAQSEHIVDWSEANDSSRRDAERKLYDLWRDTFNRLYGEEEQP